MKNRFILIISLLGLVGGLLMIFSDQYLRDRLFGINLVVIPLSFVIVTTIALLLINRTIDYEPSVGKSIGFSFSISLISSLLFGFYWSSDFFSVKISGAAVIQSMMLVLPQGIVVSLIIGLIFRNKKCKKKTNVA